MKKGMTALTLGVLFIAVTGFLVTWLVIDAMKNRAEGKTADELCRISIATREKTGVRVEKAGIGTEVEIAPLLCKTEQSEDIGSDKTKEEVKKYIAEKIARCWYRYQQGDVKDVFVGESFGTKCQVYQPFNVEKWKDYSGPITSEELIEFMYSNIYKVVENHDNCKMFGGYCEENCNELNNEKKYEFKEDDDTKCSKEETEKICCYSPYDCWNKGGECFSGEPGNNYVKYDRWNCPKGKECYLKDNYYTYYSYVKESGGLGRMIILTEDIKPGESYTVSFGSPTKGEGITSFYTKLGAALGAAGGVTLIALGASTPPGWIGLGIYVAAHATMGAVIGNLYGEGAVEVRDAYIKLFSERDINTVYLSTYNDAVNGNFCEVVE